MIAFEVWELFIVIAFAAATIATPWLLGLADRATIVALHLAGVLAIAISTTRRRNGDMHARLLTGSIAMHSYGDEDDQS